MCNLLSFFLEVFEAKISDRENILYPNFSTTFNTVPEERLITKVEAHKIENVCNWIMAWLMDKKQS